MVENQTSFQFKNFQVLDSHISIKHDLSLDNGMNLQLLEAGRSVNGSSFFLDLNVKIHNNNNSINIDLTARGIFKFNSELPAEAQDAFFKYNAPALLFPYIRSYITSLTALSGIPALVLPTINLSRSLEKNNH